MTGAWTPSAKRRCGFD